MAIERYKVQVRTGHHTGDPMFARSYGRNEEIDLYEYIQQVAGSSGGGSSDHGTLTGLTDDDHTQYHNDTRGDVRYHQKTEFINTSAGAGDVDKPIKLNASGQINDNMISSPVSGSTLLAALYSLGLGANGTFLTMVGSNPTWINPGNVLTGTDNAASGYFDIGAMRIQWGVEATGSASGYRTVTLPAAFANTSYSIQATAITASISTYRYVFLYTAGITTTTFQCRVGTETGSGGTEGFHWFAVGLRP